MEKIADENKRAVLESFRTNPEKPFIEVAKETEIFPVDPESVPICVQEFPYKNLNIRIFSINLRYVPVAYFSSCFISEVYSHLNS